MREHQCGWKRERWWGKTQERRDGVKDESRVECYIVWVNNLELIFPLFCLFFIIIVELHDGSDFSDSLWNSNRGSCLPSWYIMFRDAMFSKPPKLEEVLIFFVNKHTIKHTIACCLVPFKVKCDKKYISHFLHHCFWQAMVLPELYGIERIMCLQVTVLVPTYAHIHGVSKWAAGKISFLS